MLYFAFKGVETMIVKKLRRVCERCNKMFVPNGKRSRICYNCYRPKGNTKGINVAEVRRWLMN